MEQLTNIPSTQEEYIKACADGLRKNAQDAVRMMQFGNANSDNEEEVGQMMKEMTKPMELTPQVIQEIKNLEASESIIWYVETNLDTQMDASVMSCDIHLLDDRVCEDLKDEPNDYSIDSKKNVLSMRLGHCLKVYEHEDDNHLKCIQYKSLDEKNLILGTIAKTIYGNGMPQLGALQFLKPKDGDKNKIIKPKKLFFSSEGIMKRVLPHLEAMGIKRKNVVSCSKNSIMRIGSLLVPLPFYKCTMIFVHILVLTHFILSRCRPHDVSAHSSYRNHSGSSSEKKD